jgi:hypothetical protein
MLMFVQFGSGKITPPQLTRSAVRMLDGANDDNSITDLSTGSSPSSGSSTPTPPRGSSPSPPSETESYPAKSLSPQIARSSSPLPRAGTTFGNRPVSPAAFGYPFRQPSPNTFLSEASAPTAIHG